VEHLDRVDGPVEHVRLEAATDDLDLGELRHPDRWSRRP
jgi:hypothetical protein